MVVATTVAVLMANTTLYVGPIALALGGADLSAFAGPILGGAIYAVLWLTTSPYRDPARRPGIRRLRGPTRLRHPQTMMRSRRMPRHPPPATWRCPHDLAHAR